MYKTILLPISLEQTTLTEKAAEAARALAQCFNADLHFLSVTPDFGMPTVASFFPDDAVKKASVELAKKLKIYINQYFPGSSTAHAKVMEGRPVECILKQAKKIGAELIIVPAHDEHSMDVLLMGSTAAKLAERAACTVMVVR